MTNVRRGGRGLARTLPSIVIPDKRTWVRANLPRSLSRPEQSVAGVAEAGKDVAVRVELAVERGGEDWYIWVRGAEPRHAFRRGDETEELDARSTGPLKRRDRTGRAAARGEHRVEQEELALGGVSRDLEVVVHRLEGVVVAVEADVTDTRGGHELEDALHHS